MEECRFTGLGDCDDEDWRRRTVGVVAEAVAAVSMASLKADGTVDPPLLLAGDGGVDRM